MGTITDSGNHVVFTNLHCHVLKEPFIASDHRIVASGHRSPINGLYNMSEKLYQCEAHSILEIDKAALWHK
jgi:hypothetical protein